MRHFTKNPKICRELTLIFLLNENLWHHTMIINRDYFSKFNSKNVKVLKFTYKIIFLLILNINLFSHLSSNKNSVLFVFLYSLNKFMFNSCSVIEIFVNRSNET